MQILILLLILLPVAFILVNFVFYLSRGEIKTNRKAWAVIEIWTVLLSPTLFLFSMDLEKVNDCCYDSAVFSPEHRIGIYALITLCILAYLTSLFRNEVFPPILELLINMFLVLGLIINVLLCFHLSTIELGPLFWVFGNVPIIILILINLAENQKRLKRNVLTKNFNQNGFINKICLSILKLDPIYKYPFLLILLVPVIIFLSLFLLIFGQKPDSIIRAFTDTYKHGFSQLDYMCENVECGGHFLCSVGANGHKNFVKPIRYGVRNGRKIVCNRQLLISNAFEELIQESSPFFHKLIRKKYNKVGDLIHKYYYVFEVKLFSDLIYLMMKPLEWTFLLILYTFDKNPENRIAMQYLSEKEKQIITASNNVSLRHTP